MGLLLRGFVLVVAMASVAWAFATRQPPREVRVTLDALHPPIIEAEIVDAGWVPEAGDVRLRGNGQAVTAQRIRTFAEAGPRTAIVFVMSGLEVWIGNDSFETEPTATFQGALEPFKRAIDALGIAKRLPSGSEFAIVTYTSGAEVRTPLTPIAQLTGASFGEQKDYQGQIGSDLIAGIREGANQLESSRAPVKLMIIVGDGNNTNRDEARASLTQLKQQFRIGGIQVATLVYKTTISEPGFDLRYLVPELTVANTDTFAPLLEYDLRRLTDRFYATFDASTLPIFTGHKVDLFIEVPGKAIDPVTVTFGAPLAASERARGWTTSGWLQLCAAISLFAMLAAFMRSLARE